MTWTLAKIRSKIQKEMVLEDESFIESSELDGFINDAIRDAEAHIHKLGCEDEYFLAKTSINLVNGTTEYSLPEDIYATKIRRIMYVNGIDFYEVRRVRGTNKFKIYYAMNLEYSQSEEYRYQLINNSDTGPVIESIPPSYETITAGWRMWYIRKAKELVYDTDVLDIPEFVSYIINHVKVRCYEKEVGHPNLAKSISDRDASKDLMIQTLTEQVPDDDTEVEQDLRHYEESV